MQEGIVIIGAGGHCKLVIDILVKNGRYRILGLLDQEKPKGYDVLGCEVIGKITDFRKLLPADCNVFIAIGSGVIRNAIAEDIKNVRKDIKFPSVIHPSAIIGEEVTIGEGVSVSAGVIVNPSARIHPFALINTKASIGHDSRVCLSCTIGPGVTIGGNVKIDGFTTVGMGANIIQGISIGSYSTIGAGALLLKDCNPHSKMYGVPAKKVG